MRSICAFTKHPKLNASQSSMLARVAHRLRDEDSIDDVDIRLAGRQITNQDGGCGACCWLNGVDVTHRVNLHTTARLGNLVAVRNGASAVSVDRAAASMV